MQTKGAVQLGVSGSSYVPGQIVRVAGNSRGSSRGGSPPLADMCNSESNSSNGDRLPTIGGALSAVSPAPASARDPVSRSASGPEVLQRCTSSGASNRTMLLSTPSLLRGSSAQSASSSGSAERTNATDLSGLIQRKTLSSTLTPSMALIADQDRVVEFRGGGLAPFDVGGRHGNAVTATKLSSVHKGWRVVAVDGRRLQPADIRAALAAVRKRSRYTVSFRLGEKPAAEDEKDGDLASEAADAEASRRRQAEEEEREAEEERRRRAEADLAAQRAAAEAAELEEARRRAAAELEAEREREAAAAREAERRAAAAANAAAEDEAFRKRRAAAAAAEAAKRERDAAAAAAEAAAAAARDAERRKAQEEAEAAAEEKRQQVALAKERQAVQRRLEEQAVLPARDSLADPQASLLQALARAATPAPAAQEKRGGPCDKCDGPHHEDDCPHFKGKKRIQHKDALERYNPKGTKSKASDGGGGDAGERILRGARLIPQPGDGSCLFHSLSYGLKTTHATKLRADVADYIARNPDAVVAGNPIKDWVLWDSGLDVCSYAKTMRTGSRWGGAVEIAVCAQLTAKPVHVYERGPQGFKRISAFGDDKVPSDQAINVHYGGRVHYDALEL